MDVPTNNNIVNHDHAYHFTNQEHGSFGQSCFAASKHAEMVVQRISSVFRMKPLDMKHLQEDTMLMRQQRHREKNQMEKFEWLKRRMVEEEIQNERQLTIYDRLVDAIDFVLDTKSKYGQRYGGEGAVSMSFAKPTTKDLRSFRNLNRLIVEDALDTSTTQQLICQKCLLAIQQ